MGKGKTGRKGDEVKSNGGRGGGEEEKKKKCPHYTQSIWNPHFQLKSLEALTGGGGGGEGVNFWSFVDTFCNFVRTN